MNINSVNARENLLGLIYRTQAPHIASSLSMIDFLTATLERSVSRLKQSGVQDDIVLSKGHAAAGFYAVLRTLNLISEEEFDSYYADGSDFYGHISHKSTNWSALSTGSLGHGLPFAVGLSLGNRIDSRHNQESIVIMSDGECDEGSVWEAALIASHHKLGNLKVLIDRNKLQSLTDTESTLALEPLKEKWESFGWNVTVINGHSHIEISDALSLKSEKPNCIIADTVKGKGVSFMENEVLWHYRAPNLDEFLAAKDELLNK